MQLWRSCTAGNRDMTRHSREAPKRFGDWPPEIEHHTRNTAKTTHWHQLHWRERTRWLPLVVSYLGWKNWGALCTGEVIRRSHVHASCKRCPEQRHCTRLQGSLEVKYRLSCSCDGLMKHSGRTSLLVVTAVTAQLVARCVLNLTRRMMYRALI